MAPRILTKAVDTGEAPLRMTQEQQTVPEKVTWRVNNDRDLSPIPMQQQGV